MNINELSIGQIKEIQSLIGVANEGHPYQIGKNYLIRTVTMAFTGRIVAVTSQEIVLEDAAWIPDLGRFNEAVEKGTFSEVEPFQNEKVIIGRGALIDATIVTYKLPKSVK